MKYSQILEGVEYGDLASLITTRVSIAEFEPKTGTNNDVVVIGFFCKDEAPAQDLASFIERGVADVLDTEVSPSADEDGYYLCFVEINNEDLMKVVFVLLDDISRLTDITEWTLDFYHGTETNITADRIKEWLKNQ